MTVLSGTWSTTVKQRQPRHLVIILLIIFLLATFQSLRKPRSQTGYGEFTSPSVAHKTTSKKRLLVTGAAGFIGMSLSIALAGDGHTVVGIDDFNDYYDVDLKRDRAYELYRRNIEVLRLDVCDRSGLQEIFKEHRFTHVVHLAAQAGVRYSIENPLAYVRANVQCFATLLEVVRHFPGTYVTYASSSSVYGRNTKVPFDVSDRIDYPSSLYAATKKSNEDFARVYHHLYKIPMTGLRFFTVYGPWGRPDMAVYKFSAQIMENRSIDVYDEGTLQRDFTYIDDIVDGIKAAINHGANFEIFNIGKGHPETVSDLIVGLENVLERRAIKNYLPMQPGDVKTTYADIGHTRSQLGFAPKITLQEGLSRWAAWYLERREDLEGGNFAMQKEYYENKLEAGVSTASTLVTAVPEIRKGGTAGGVVLTSILEHSEAAMNCLKSLYSNQIPSVVFVSKEVLSTLDTVTLKNSTVQILLVGDDEQWRMNFFRHLKAHLLELVKMEKAPEYLVFVESKKVDFSRNPFSDIQRTHKKNGFTFFLQLEVYRSDVLTQDCKACFGLSERGFGLGQLNSTHESAFSPDMWGGPFNEFMFLLNHMNSVLYTEKKLLYSEITIECLRVAFIIAVKRLAGYARISAGHGGHSKDEIFSPARSKYCTGTQALYAVYHLPVCKSSH